MDLPTQLAHNYARSGKCGVSLGMGVCVGLLPAAGKALPYVLRDLSHFLSLYRGEVDDPSVEDAFDKLQDPDFELYLHTSFSPQNWCPNHDGHE